MEEVWKDIPSDSIYKYQISNMGRVRSLPKTIKYSDGRVFRYQMAILTPKPNRNRYLHVNLFYAKGKSKTWDLQRLVAIAFIPNPENKPEVNHINGDKSDNRVCNLEWNTSQENKEHGMRIGIYSKERMRITQKMGIQKIKENAHARSLLQ